MFTDRKELRPEKTPDGSAVCPNFEPSKLLERVRVLCCVWGRESARARERESWLLEREQDPVSKRETNGEAHTRARVTACACMLPHDYKCIDGMHISKL